jgi:DNA-binding MarR family transcriptional regulator
VQLQRHHQQLTMKKRPSDAAVEAWVSLIRTQQALLQRVERDLAAAGLPPLEWYDVLLELERAPGRRLRHRELHPRLLVAKYNLSRLIDRLESRGLVRRSPVEGDARGAYIAITEDGGTLRRRMWPVYAGAIERHFAGRLDAGDIARLASILQRLR